MKGLLLNDYYSIKKWWLFLIVLPFFPLFASLLALWGGSSDEVYISMLGIGFSVGFFIAFGAFYEVMKENESAQWMKQALVAITLYCSKINGRIYDGKIPVFHHHIIIYRDYKSCYGIYFVDYFGKHRYYTYS